MFDKNQIKNTKITKFKSRTLIAAPLAAYSKLRTKSLDTTEPNAKAATAEALTYCEFMYWQSHSAHTPYLECHDTHVENMS